MKKVLVIVCALAVLALTACGSNQEVYLPEAEDDTMYTTAGEFGGV